MVISQELISLSAYTHNSPREKGDIEIKIARYWNISHIYIDETRAGMTWAYTAVNYDWCSGSGTWNDPYLIENVTIDGYSGNGITIVSSVVPFIIKNCTVINSVYGIDIQNVSHGRIVNNNFSNNTWIGLEISNSWTFAQNNNTISGNIINNNFEGMHISNSLKGNILSNNTCNNNVEQGIRCVGSNNTFIGNTINHNNEGILLSNPNNTIIWNNFDYNNVGIHISDDNNKIKLNNITNSMTTGIHLLDSSKYNSIVNNIIKENPKGISLEDEANNNTFKDNMISNNVDNGIFIKYEPNPNYVCRGNLFYMNYFENPTGINAEDNGETNLWNYSTLGNYWYDYYSMQGGKDINDDGIGDIPYNVSGLANSKDHFPIWWDGPELAINKPKPFVAFGTTAPDFNISINEGIPDTMWYTIDGGITNFTCLTIDTVNQSAWDDLDHGLVNLTFYANDSRGFLWSNAIQIYKDLKAPRITLVSPINNQLCGLEAPIFDVIIEDFNVHRKWYSLQGGRNITFTIETQINQTEWDKYGNGTVVIEFFANDTLGNLNSSQIILRKDSYIPIIRILEPHSNETFGAISPSFNLTIYEETIVLTWYQIQAGTHKFYFTGLSGSINQERWMTSSNGPVIITFYAQDEAGNVGTNSTIVIKDVSTPPVRNMTVTTIADKDTYVNSYYALNNYGDANYLLSGYYLTDEVVESYFYFSFRDKPSNWVQAEISLDVWSVSQTTDLSVCIIEEEWDETTLNFINRPVKENEITTIHVSNSKIYTIDITEYIEGRTYISICVYVDINDYLDDYICITSREGYALDAFAPQLIWTYETEVKEPQIYGYGLFLLLVGMSIGLVIVYILIKKNLTVP
ncbi:MAG: NosD domain-containing protein [Promethearchaeota archaeon]